MKKVLTIAAAVTFLFACNENQEKTNEQPSLTTGKSAVIFYSQTGTTALVARELAKQTHAELVELQMTTPYPSTYDSTVSAVRIERENKSWPALQKARFDLSKFDTLYVGYPVMFGTFAPPLYTFLDSNELSGKYLVPFCTYGSGGRKSSSRELASLASNARSLLSFGISKRRGLSPNTDLTKEIRNFLNLVRAGIQEEERLASFGDSQELSGKDSSVFASAVKEYAYLNLQPIRVAKDSAGTGFLFSCRMRAFGAEENVTVQVFKSLSENGEAELIAVEK